MKLDVSSLKTSEQEIVGCYLECHGPGAQSKDEFSSWVARMIDRLGPDDCQFLIRSRQTHLRHMWLAKGNYLYVPQIWEAGRYTWGEAAVKTTNNRRLEALRIINQAETCHSVGQAIDSTGRLFILYKNRRADTDAPAPLPDYQGRWDLNYGDGMMGQNGEQLPGPSDE